MLDGRCRGLVVAAVALGATDASCRNSAANPPAAPTDDVDLPVPAEGGGPAVPRRRERARPGASEVVQPNGPPQLPPAEPPPVPSVRSSIGGRCSESSDCELGLSCFDAPEDGALVEAIPGGYCAPPCSEDADCADVAPSSICWAGRHCTAPCAAARDNEADGAPKCGGRDELACVGSATNGSCQPSCVNDLSCGPGRECFFGSGTCLLFGSSDALAADAPIGSPCNGAALDCRGYCIDSGAGTASLCSGVCSVGVSGCGGGLSNVCVPRSVDGRRGDIGNCHQACKSSADCAVEQGECVPSGLLSATSEPLAHCAPRRPEVPTSVSQRLPLEGMPPATALPPEVVYVQSSVSGGALSRLFLDDGAACIEGELPEPSEAEAGRDAGARGAGASHAQLSFQLGRIDPPSSRDISGTETLNLTLTSDRGVFVYASFLGRPGFEYGAFITEPTPEQQAFAFTPDELRPRQLGALPWDSRLLDAVTLRLADGAGPFRACVSALAFE